MLQVPDDALAPMGLAAAQALAAGRKALAARKPPAAGDAATQQKTLSRLGLPRHTAFFEAEEAALEQVSSQQGSAVRFSAGGFVGFGEAAATSGAESVTRKSWVLCESPWAETMAKAHVLQVAVDTSRGMVGKLRRPTTPPST